MDQFGMNQFGMNQFDGAGNWRNGTVCVLFSSKRCVSGVGF